MLVSSIPTKLDIIFASGATGTYVRTIPDTTSDPNAASWTLGFPPNTFVDPGAGGKPPDGRDINGLGQMLSAWTRWLNAGGPIFYDAAFSASIGGYPRWAMLDNASSPGQFWISNVDNNTSNPDTGGGGWIPFPPSAAISVTSFNGRTGAVSLNQADVVNAVAPGGFPVNRLAAAVGAGPQLLGVPTGAGPGTTPTYNPPSSYGVAPFTFLQVQAQGSDAALTASAWTPRAFNATAFNSIAGASLNVSNGQITLPAGTYHVDATGGCQTSTSQVNNFHQMRAHVVSGATLCAGQTNAYAGGANNNVVLGVLDGFFVLGSTTTLTIDSWVLLAASGGNSQSTGETQVLSSATFTKIA